MRVGPMLDRFASTLLSSNGSQTFLGKIMSHIELWQGFGAGTNVGTSGEMVLFSLLKERLEREHNGIVFDVGANVGDFTAAGIQSLGKRVTIHAFEPAQRVFQRLRARFEVNTSVRLNNFALGANSGSYALYGSGEETGLASLVKRDLSHCGLAMSFQETVKLRTLTEYTEEHRIGVIHLLKLDVEGFEMNVLAGGKKLFEGRRILLCSFEFGGCNIDSRTFFRDFYSFFNGVDMKLHRITPAGTLVPIEKYSEQQERFTTTNYVAVLPRR